MILSHKNYYLKQEKPKMVKHNLLHEFLKAEQSFENREKEVVFAEIDPNNNKQRTWWDATKVYELLRPTKKIKI